VQGDDPHPRDPIALSSLAWKWMFDSLYSVINWMLMTLHIIDYPWQWLGEPGWRCGRDHPHVWRGFPFSRSSCWPG